MFTGIITEIGRVKSNTGSTLIVSAPKISGDLKPGDSVCMNGACVTVTEKVSWVFKADILEETIKRTNLGRLRTDDTVNLELSLEAGDRMNGHIVTGHVDGTGRLMRSYRKGRDRIIEIEVPYRIAGYLAAKGSVCVDGVSLTIAKKMSNRFTVHLIPYTLKYTTLGGKKTGSLLNIEVDILVRYARDLP